MMRKKVLLAILLMAPVIAWAGKPNPAKYPITVHVQSSRLVNVCGNVMCVAKQYLTVVIDGKKYELHGKGNSEHVLRLGDYKAKVIEEEAPQGSDEPLAAYEYKVTYEFLFPDGKTRKYDVVGEEE